MLLKSKKTLKGCFGCFFTIGLLGLAVLIVAFLFFDPQLNLRGNLVYVEFANSRAPMEIKQADGEWIKAEDLTPESFKSALDDQTKIKGKGVSWQTLHMRRPAHNWRENLINTCVKSEVHVIRFDPEYYEFSPWFELDSDQFKPQTIKTALSQNREAGLPTFAINANYYGPDGQPLGWIVKDGDTIRKRWKGWSGFFFVKDGVPHFGPRSSLDENKGELKHALQGYPSVMKNGTVWKYVENDDDKFFNGSELNFRSLAGIDQQGHCIFILSGRGGLMKMADVAQLALLAGIQDATLLDGGKALQYGMIGRLGKARFNSYNNELPKKWFRGRLKPQKPPVFLLVQKRRDK